MRRRSADATKPLVTQAAAKPVALAGSSGTRSRRIPLPAAVYDCTFLVGAVWLSLALFVGRLGFYYDDYSVLQRMNAANGDSLRAVYHAVRPATGQRPLQAFEYAVLYRLFGLHSLGYHLAGGIVLGALVILLYLALRELRLPRPVAVALPLVYATLPHYATNRFWLDAFQIDLSTACYVIGLYAGLRALRSSRLALGGWIALAAAGVVASLLAYEVVFPLFALNLVLIWWAGRKLHAGPFRLGLTLGALVVAMIAVSAVKTALVAAGGQNGYRLGFQEGLVHHLAYLVSGVLKVNLGTYFLAFPYVLWWLLRNRFSLSAVALSALGGLLVYVYLSRLGRREPSHIGWSRRGLAAAGLAAFLLGYAIFLTNENVLFRSAGIDNRVNAAAALGVAAILVAAVDALVQRVDARRRVVAFSACIACVVAASIFVVDGLGSFWTAASARQDAIVTGLTRKLGPRPGAATIVLDGSCPEIGPAVVFADQYDLTGALRLNYPDAPLRADVAAGALHAAPRGLRLDRVFLGQRSSVTYRYGSRLLVYDAPAGRLFALSGRREALRYLTRVRPAFSCPPQRSFAWGFKISRWWPFA